MSRRKSLEELDFRHFAHVVRDVTAALEQLQAACIPPEDVLAAAEVLYRRSVERGEPNEQIALAATDFASARGLSAAAFGLTP